jgi:hypothetical protein
LHQQREAAYAIMRALLLLYVIQAGYWFQGLLLFGQALSFLQAPEDMHVMERMVELCNMLACQISDRHSAGCKAPQQKHGVCASHGRIGIHMLLHCSPVVLKSKKTYNAHGWPTRHKTPTCDAVQQVPRSKLFPSSPSSTAHRTPKRADSNCSCRALQKNHNVTVMQHACTHCIRGKGLVGPSMPTYHPMPSCLPVPCCS